METRAFPRRARRARRVRRPAIRGRARFLSRRFASPSRRRERVEASRAPARERVRRAGRFCGGRVSAGRRVPRNLIIRRRRGVRAVVRPGARGVRTRVVRVRRGVLRRGDARARRRRVRANAEDDVLPRRRVDGAVPLRRLAVRRERRRARRRLPGAARRHRRARPARARVRSCDRLLRARRGRAKREAGNLARAFEEDDARGLAAKEICTLGVF